MKNPQSYLIHFTAKKMEHFVMMIRLDFLTDRLRFCYITGIHHAKFGNHGYFFSWENKVTENLTVAWFTGRNICRRHCMDLVSLGNKTHLTHSNSKFSPSAHIPLIFLETSEENEFVKARMIKSATRFFWTSGRKCNFKGCDRDDLKPAIVRGWFWSGSGVRLGN